MASYVGKYTIKATKNPLADDQLMSKQTDTYGGYEKYSIGRTVNQKPNPGVQNRGNVQNGD
jgi:hypothetical protein